MDESGLVDAECVEDGGEELSIYSRISGPFIYFLAALNYGPERKAT